jgi:hypothetical protein
MKKIKHSKFKNTGFLFELLTRQITLEIMNNSDEKAKKIVKEFFSGKTELAKELRLFNLLINEKYSSETRAEKFIDVILEAHGKINQSKIQKEKYELVKSIKENFNISDFLASPVTNYKVLASIHKLFEAKNQNIGNIKDVFNSKGTLIEHISSKTVNHQHVDSKLIENYKKQEKDVRLLTYKILLENFNKKYSNLDKNQKDLLREYINNVNNTSKFKEYYTEKADSVCSKLDKLHNLISDKVTQIKLKETANVIRKQTIGRKVSDKQVSALMLSFELIKEIRRANNKGKQ